MSKNLTDMVPVKWIKPGSRHHNVVHYVHQDLIHPTDTADQVIVFWPRKGKKKAEKWDAVLVKDTTDARSTTPITIESKLLRIHADKFRYMCLQFLYFT